MNQLIRFSSGLLCLGVLGGVMLASDLACPPHWVGGQRPSLPDERGREAKLREMHEATHRRLQAKRQVAGEVIARRQSLAEAIEQFRAWDQVRLQTAFSLQKPEDVGMPEDEFIGRNVLHFVQQVLADRPDEAAEVVSRLEKELQRTPGGAQEAPSCSG